MQNFKRNTLSWGVRSALVTLISALAVPAIATAEEQEQTIDSNKLEVIQVTARKRTENVQEVPIAVSALQGDQLDVLSSAGMDIRFMNGKVPSLSVESSFGRTFPRFYMRGLGNSDFDLNASQPVSLVFDGVVQENPILKGFPVFDVDRVEVLRGPQGTLFGRNTPAGLVKFDSKRPTQDVDGYMSVAKGTHNTFDVQGAIGFGLTDNLSTRISLLRQERDDYIDNKAPGSEYKDQIGGYEEEAGRIQFLYDTDNFSALLNYHYRDLDASPIPFYANAIKKGSNNLASGFDRDTVYHDAATRARQNVETNGANLTLEFDLGYFSLTSISGYESAEIYSQADVDGGYGAVFLDDFQGPLYGDDTNFIAFAAESADAIPDHEQITQELRLSTNNDGFLNYQFGVFYFSEDLTIESLSFDSLAGGAENGYAKQEQETTAWAVFGSADFAITDKLKVTTGLRYSEDDKELFAERFQNPTPWNGSPDSITGEANPDDSHVSWDISATYALTDNTNVYGRIADGYRAPSIQGRILFGDEVTVAESETILSFETGLKSDVLDGRGRFNANVFYFQMDDQQLTAVGGDNTNTTSLINAQETEGYGFEIDSEFIVTDNLFVTASVSYNNTEINDPNLAVAPCSQCTVLDALDDGGKAMIHGNNLPHAPEWIYNFTARYAVEVGIGEAFVYTDWSYRSEIDFFLYDSTEFEGEALIEGGVRAGYTWDTDSNTYELAIFGRNITDEEVVIGAVDFNNNTGIINEGRFVGAEFNVSFF